MVDLEPISQRCGEPRSFWEWAESRPDHCAVRASDSSSTTYGELAQRSNQISHALRADGLSAGDRVAALVGNGIDYFEIALASAQVGVHLVPLNTHLSAAELSYIIDDCGARLVIFDDEHAALAGDALDKIGYPPERRVGDAAGGSARSLSDLTRGMPAAPPDDRVNAQPMLYTSGTTGRPKGVAYPSGAGSTPEQSVAAGQSLMARRGLVTDPSAVTLITGPLYHGAPGAWAIQALHRGHSVVLLGRWDSESALRTIEAHRVTTTQMAPIHFFRLLQLPEHIRSRFDVSSLRVVCHAGAACPIDVKTAMIAWFGPVLYEYYASSEGFGTSITSSEWLEHPGSVGRADGDGAVMKVLDDDGVEVGVDVVGTLWIRNPGGVLSEYLNAPEKTAASHRDGFYTAGDLARIDADGWLYIVDRRADLILSGGVNIYPAEVERALLSHPDIAEAVVVGVPDDEWGQRVHAVMVARAGVPAGPALQAEVLDHACRSLAKFKLPRSVEFRDRLPYTATGKLFRRSLVDEAAGRPAGPSSPRTS